MMSDNKTEVNNKLNRFFGTAKKEDEDEIIRIFEVDESDSDKTDASSENVGDALTKPASDKSGDTSEFDLPEESDIDSGLDVEKIVKEYYNENHSASIEDKIANLKENAAQGFDEENNASDDDVKAVPVFDENEKTKEHGMSQLLTLLQDDDEESGKSKKKKKKFKDSVVNGFTEETEAVVTEVDDSEEADEGVRYAVPGDNTYNYDFEYTEKSQTNALFNSLRKNAVISSVALIVSLVAAIICTWLEIGIGSGELFGKTDLRINAMAALQMLALCVFFNLDGLSRGIKKLSLKNSAPEACAVAVSAVCALHTIWSAIAVKDADIFRTYCFVGCIMLFFLSVNSLIKSYTRYKAFAVVVSPKPKLATGKLDSLSEENGIFAKYLKEYSEVLGVSKTASVTDFIKRTHTVPFEGNAPVSLMYVSVIVCVIAALVSVFVLDKTAVEAINGATGAFMLAVPVSSLLVTALPYLFATIKVGKFRAAILGEAATDTYENASAISFDDTEVFPPKAAKVISIKTYNEHPIDKIVICMAKAFRKLGGPLSYVFESSVQDGVGDVDNEVSVVETSADGIRLKIGMDDILIGNGAYLRLYDIEAPVDDIDENETRSLVSIVYLVCNNSLAAKFYIRYGINAKFEAVLKEFHDSGICCGVKTFDPSITDELIKSSLKGEDYRINVIRKNAKEIGLVEETLDTGLVSLSGVHGFLSSFIIVDKLRGKYRTNTIFCMLGGIIGLAVALALLLVSNIPSLSLILLYQLLWLIPTAIISIFVK